jgi:hypothetical protein
MNMDRLVIVVSQVAVMGMLGALVEFGHGSAVIDALLGVFGGSLAGHSVVEAVTTLKRNGKIVQ